MAKVESLIKFTRTSITRQYRWRNRRQTFLIFITSVDVGYKKTTTKVVDLNMRPKRLSFRRQTHSTNRSGKIQSKRRLSLQLSSHKEMQKKNRVNILLQKSSGQFIYISWFWIKSISGLLLSVFFLRSVHGTNIAGYVIIKRQSFFAPHAFDLITLSVFQMARRSPIF